MQFSLSIAPLAALLISQAAAEPLRATLVGRQLTTTSIPPSEATMIYSILPISPDPDAPTTTAEEDQILTILPTTESTTATVSTPATTEQIFSILPVSSSGEGIVDLNPTTTDATTSTVGGNSSATASQPGQSVPPDSAAGRVEVGVVAAIVAAFVGVVGML